ncbi:MAG: C2H2-type zinc finger protein [Candidatus Nitrosotenuis sp.]
MITIDCREIEHLQHDLAVFASDWLGAIPTMKLHEFVLSTFDDAKLDPEHVVKAIKEFFASIGETANYGVLPKDGIIMIKSLHERPLQKARTVNSMYSCTHCGYVTPYEVLLQNHMKIHYL